MCVLAWSSRSQILLPEWLYGNVRSGSSLLSKNKPGTDYSFASKSYETCGFVMSPAETWEFLVEILSSFQFEIQNETWGGREWTHTNPQERICSNKPLWNAAANGFRINPHSKNENKSKHIPLSKKSDSWHYQKSLFSLWATPFLKKKKKKKEQIHNVLPN